MQHDDLSNFGIRKQVTHPFFFSFFLFVVFSACLPLSVNINGLQIFTPYVVVIFFAFLILLVWILFPKRIIKRKEEFAFIAAMILPFLTATLSVDPSDAFKQSVNGLYAATVFLIIKYCLRMRLLKSDDIQLIAFFLFYFLTVVAMLQIVLQEPVGIISNYFGAGDSQTSRWQGELRISGTFGNANVFAQVYVLYSSILLSKYLYSHNESSIYKAIFISGVTFFIVGASLSRSGLLFALVLHFVIYTLSMKNSQKKQKLLLIFVSFVTIFILYVVFFLVLKSGLIDRAERFTDLNFSNRFETYLGALNLLQDPLVAVFGVGSGQFFEGSATHEIYYSYKSWMDQTEINSSVHNWLLQIATENGLIVMMLYLYAIIKTAQRGWQKLKAPGGWLAATFSIVLIVLYFVPLQFTTTANSPWILTPVAIIFACIHREQNIIVLFQRS